MADGCRQVVPRVILEMKVADFTWLSLGIPAQLCHCSEVLFVEPFARETLALASRSFWLAGEPFAHGRHCRQQRVSAISQWGVSFFAKRLRAVAILKSAVTQINKIDANNRG